MFRAVVIELIIYDEKTFCCLYQNCKVSKIERREHFKAISIETKLLWQFSITCKGGEGKFSRWIGLLVAQIENKMKSYHKTFHCFIEKENPGKTFFFTA